jgi:hypothetical protein
MDCIGCVLLFARLFRGGAFDVSEQFDVSLPFLKQQRSNALAGENLAAMPLIAND